LVARGIRTEIAVNLSSGRDRRPLAVVVTTDGRRVYVPLGGASEFALLSFLRPLLVGLELLLGLIIGSRRENRGSRR
jgi:hypothetical protein